MKLEVGKLHIDKYKQPDGSYEDVGGCSYDCAEDFIQCHVLDFCGCGDQATNVRYVGKMLQHVHDLKESVWTKDISYEEWQEQGRSLGTQSSYSSCSTGLTKKVLPNMAVQSPDG